ARLREANVFSALDEQLARRLGRIAGESRPDVLLAAAVTSRGTRQGHVCVDLARVVSETLVDPEGEPIADFAWPSAASWLSAIKTSPLVGGPDDTTPLVLGGKRLYLRRYFAYETRLAEQLRARIAPLETQVDGKLLRAGLDRLFPAGQGDLQRLAALSAVVRRFCVISGGPGTGKTSTVVKILALLVEQALNAGKKKLHIVMVAPTGKAAARLRESIQKEKTKLDCTPEILALIPEDATTIHRRMRPIGGSSTRFRHDADHPIPADVLLVDEASMVDLSLMTRLVEALPPHARLILLGDRNQLASVETGAILGDICGPASAPGFSRPFAQHVTKLVGKDELTLQPDAPPAVGIGDCIVQLRKSWRYAESSGISALAHAIHDGDAARACALLEAGKHPDVVLRPGLEANALGAALSEHAVERYRAYLEKDEPAACFEALNAFRILCAHRTGPFGVETLNEQLEAALADANLLEPEGRFYLRRPILITQNDYQVGLFNGDVGVVLPAADDPRSLRVWFVDAEGKQRALAPSRLPPHETVFAMTVHKAQGSEFDEVAIVLPDTATQVLTRELLYTAITRPRKRVTIYGDLAVIAEAIKRPVERASGLRERLWT
ncbi:MAG TPA: exodeoxyribonuclease V subunit alpha, partial [Polyangiaceae bacterium]